MLLHNVSPNNPNTSPFASTRKTEPRFLGGLVPAPGRPDRRLNSQRSRDSVPPVGIPFVNLKIAQEPPRFSHFLLRFLPNGMN